MSTLTPGDPPARPAVALLVYPGFSEFEVTVALALLSRTHDIVNVGLSLEPVRGEGGLRVLPEQRIEDLKASGFAALLIPGAADMAVLRDQEALTTLARDLHAKRRVLAAICGGPFVLGQAGVLEGLSYTVTFTPEQRAFLGVFPEAGFEYRDVVRSGHVITGQGHAFAEFGLAVAEALGAVRNVEGARRFYRGQGNPGMEQATSGETRAAPASEGGAG